MEDRTGREARELRLQLGKLLVLVAELQVQGDGPIELFLAGKGIRAMIDLSLFNL